MAEGSVGKVQLDIEISRGSIQREIRSLGPALGKALQATIAAPVEAMKRSLKGLSAGMKEAWGGGASDAEEMSARFGGSIAKMRKYMGSLESSVTKAEAKISDMRAAIADLYAEQDVIIREYARMPPLAGMTKDESLERLLASDTGFGKLSAQIDRIQAQMQPLIEKNRQAKEEILELGTAIEQAGERASSAGDKIEAIGETTRRAGKRAQTAGVQFGGFAKMLNRSLMTVLRRVFVYSVMLQAIRGLVNYVTSALKTNARFAASLATIKTSLAVAFQPIYNAVLPAINALMQGLARATTYIAAFLSALGGKTYAQSLQAAKGLDAAKKAMEGYGAAAKGSLAGFDEINLLPGDDAGGDGGAAMAMPDMGGMEEEAMGLAGRLREAFGSIFEPTRTALQNLWLALQPFKTFVAQGVRDFYEHFLKPVGTWVLGEGLPRFIEALSAGFMNVNWDVINVSLERLWMALAPFALNVGQGLLWLWENVLVPFGTWVMNETVPRFLDILSSGINLLNTILETLKPLGQWLLDKFLIPIAEWASEKIGGAAVDVLAGISAGLDAVSNWITENQGTVETMAIIVGSFAAAWGLATIALKAWNIAVAAWNIIGAIATGVTSAFNVALIALTSPIGIVALAIGALIAIGVLLYRNWDTVKAKAGELWEGIKKAFSPVAKFFGDLWEGVKRGFVGFVNFIIRGINALIEGFLAPINALIKGWNATIGKIAGKIPTIRIRIPEIPRLARGGIIDQPTLAMVGEGRRKEAIVPLENTAFVDKLASALGTAVLQAMQFANGQDRAHDKNIIVEMDAMQVIRILLPKLDAELQRRGLRSILRSV